MFEILISISLFVSWSLIGYAIIFKAPINNIQAILISPSIGIGLILFLTFCINRFGIPIKYFGRDLFILCIISSLIYIFIYKNKFSIDKKIVLILLVSLIVISWPFIFFGNSWLSVSNDDMANYVMAAERFLNNGYFDGPNIKNLVSGKDYSEYYWFMHVDFGARSGSELFIAINSAITGLSPDKIFMPTLAALHISMVTVVGSIAYILGTTRNSYASMAIIAISPLATWGFVQQLIGQLGGLIFLLASIFLTKFLIENSRMLHKGIIISIFIVYSSFLIWYPEMIPFLVLGFLLIAVLNVKEVFESLKKINYKNVIYILIFILILFAILNEYLVDSINFLLHQIRQQSAQTLGHKKEALFLFPFMLVPTGVPALFGFTTIINNNSLFYNSFLIIISAGLIFYIYFNLLIKLINKNANIADSILYIMFSCLFYFIITKNGFGAYKISMYMQPFIAIYLANIICENEKFKKIIYFLVIIAAILIVPIQHSYMQKSLGELENGAQQMPGISKLKIIDQFNNLFGSIEKKNIIFIALTENVFLAKLQALYTMNFSTYFISKPFFEGGILNLARNLDLDENKKLTQFKEVELKNQKFKVLKNDECINNECRYLVTTGKINIFNSQYNDNNAYFKIIEKNNLNNYLQFIETDFGNHYYLGNREKVSFYQLENDPIFKGNSFSALGQNSLFQVFGYVPGSKLRVEITGSPLVANSGLIPSLELQGVRPLNNFVGRGSGRLDFELPELVKFLDSNYLFLSFLGKPNVNYGDKSGLLGLYGKDIPRDSRQIYAYGRDISLIAPNEYRVNQVPSFVQEFPKDLLNPNLQYSGLYEDGWLSKESKFLMRKKTVDGNFKIEGFIPYINDNNFKSNINIYFNEINVYSGIHGLGDYKIIIDKINNFKGNVWVRISFDNVQVIPKDPGKVIGGKLNKIGFY